MIPAVVRVPEVALGQHHPVRGLATQLRLFQRRLRAGERRARQRDNGVADREGARIGDADDVARIGLVHRFALTREQLARPRHAHRFAQPRVGDDHVLFKPP